MALQLEAPRARGQAHRGSQVPVRVLKGKGKGVTKKEQMAAIREDGCAFTCLRNFVAACRGASGRKENSCGRLEADASDHDVMRITSVVRGGALFESHSVTECASCH